jgi:hypothetical protein
MKRLSILLLSIAIMLSAATGCGSRNEETAAESRGYEPDMVQAEAPMGAPAYDMEKEVTTEEAFSLNDQADPFLDTMTLMTDENRKITYSGSASIETETFDATLAGLEEWIKSYNGMISSSRMEDYGSYDQPRRYASYTVKIPAENFQSAVQALQDQVQVRQLSLDSQDVTDHYYDLTARIESAQTHEVRLLVLVEKATELKDVLALEQELNRIRYEIESNQGVLRRLDSQVRYSTLYLDVHETNVVLPEPTSFWDRVKNQMVRAKENVVTGLQNIILWIILWLPSLIILSIFAWILVRFFKKVKPIWKKKKDPLESDHK